MKSREPRLLQFLKINFWMREREGETHIEYQKSGRKVLKVDWRDKKNTMKRMDELWKARLSTRSRTTMRYLRAFTSLTLIALQEFAGETLMICFTLKQPLSIYASFCTEKAKLSTKRGRQEEADKRTKLKRD